MVEKEMLHRLKILRLVVGLLAFASPASAQPKIEVIVVWNAFVRSAAGKNPKFNVQLEGRGVNSDKVIFNVPSDRRLAFWTSLQARVSGVDKIDLGMSFFLTDGLEELMKDHGIGTIGVGILDDDRVVVRIYDIEDRWLGDLVYDQKTVAAETAYLRASLKEISNKKQKLETPTKPSD